MARNGAVPAPPSFGELGCLSQAFKNERSTIRASQFLPPTQKEIKRKKLCHPNDRTESHIPLGDTLDDLPLFSQTAFSQTNIGAISDRQVAKFSQKNRSILPSARKTPDFSPKRPKFSFKSTKATRLTKPAFRPPVRHDPPPASPESPEVDIEPVPSPPQSPAAGPRFSKGLRRFNSQEDLFEESQTLQAGAPAAFTRDTIYTPQPLSLPGATPGGNHFKINNLRSVDELPSQYRSVFSFPYFNIVQSKVFDDVFYRDCSLVLCAPTGSGKTAVFELAIIRILIQLQADQVQNHFKAVYMAPMKALCSERCEDWKKKFQPLGLKCLELTGDTEIDDWYQLQEVNIIMTTPEKWDSMTRKWRDNKSLVQHVKLFLVDEIHMLHDDTRGATMEAVVSRMKTVQASFERDKTNMHMRFVAVSATVPNVEDIAEWLGSKAHPAEYYRMDDSYRPVKLRKVVLGYPCSENQTDFKFDLSLNYKLATVIQTYSDQKPTLVFCATRKGVQQAAGTLVKDARFIMDAVHKERLVKYSGRLRDSKLRDLVLFGVGYHHAGMDISDRKLVEEIFLKGDLPVLLSTSTLAMGVNLPAHLVIVKSTQHYVMGMYQEYTQTQILQMIGRAGRPQFDTSATAVIMTRNMTKSKYDNLLNGAQVIESSLHKHLIEHVNAEVVLHTITDVSVAVEWLRSTFLYIRVMKNPRHYGIDVGLSKDEVEKQLQEICLKNLKSLAEAGMIILDSDDQFDVKPTQNGCHMARYCVPFETMKELVKISGTETLKELVTLISSCQGFDIQLRVNEKKTLNTMNKDKNRITIRFPMDGKIKNNQMKVNCLIQAQLGCLPIQDFALAQDTIKIFRVGTRLARCLVDILWNRPDFKSLLNALLLSKTFKSRIWENSKYVSRQLDGIGPHISNALVNAGVVTFQKLEETNPREIEMIVNRHPPFGNNVRDSVVGLPKYEVMVEQSSNYSCNSAEVTVSVKMVNADVVNKKNTAGTMHACLLLIGDTDNNTVYKVRLSDSFLNKIGTWNKKIVVQRASKGDDLSVNYISQEWVGLDVQSSYTPKYFGGSRPHVSFSEETKQKTHQPVSTAKKEKGVQNRKPCSHRCINKAYCGHDCCKLGITDPNQEKNQPAGKKNKLEIVRTPRPSLLDSCRSEMKLRMDGVPATPNLKRIKPNVSTSFVSLQDFAYTPQPKMPVVSGGEPVVTAATPKTPATGWEELDHYHHKRTIESEYSPEYEQGDSITEAMAKTGYGNYECAYFDTVGEDDGVVHGGNPEVDWDDDFLPDPRAPQFKKTRSDFSEPQWSSFTQFENPKNFSRMSEGFHPKLDQIDEGNFTEDFDEDFNAQDWNQPKKRQKSIQRENPYLKYQAKSNQQNARPAGLENCVNKTRPVMSRNPNPRQGSQKTSPISISDDDFQDSQFSDVIPPISKPKPRLGQVYAWSKSDSKSKHQFSYPRGIESSQESFLPSSGEGLSDASLRGSNPAPFVSARTIYNQNRSSFSNTITPSKSPGFSGGSDDDDLLAEYLSSQEKKMVDNQASPYQPIHTRASHDIRQQLPVPGLPRRPPLFIPEPIPAKAPTCRRENKVPYTSFFSSIKHLSANIDAGELQEAENTFSGIFEDIF